MQIHILELTSSRPTARQVARHNLALCMSAMDALGESYLSAVAAGKLFAMALRKVEAARIQDDAVQGLGTFEVEDGELSVQGHGNLSVQGPGAAVGEGVVTLHGDGLTAVEAVQDGFGPSASLVYGADLLDVEGAGTTGEMQFGGWPEGYAAETAGVVADVWLPWMQGLGNQ